MKKLLFILSTITFSMHATDITLYKYDVHNILAICAIETTLKTIYLDAFEQVYRNHWTAQFEQSYINFFDNHIEKLKHSDGMLLVVAKKDNQVAGWILFQCYEQSAVIEIICVNPTFQQQGIGKALVFSIKDYTLKIKSVTVATQKINTVSPLFYEKLGFIKTNSIPSDDNLPYEKQEYEYLIN